MGVPALKCPLDLWVYQELLFERRPRLIVETGTRFGGTTLFLAQLCDLIGVGEVISVDVQPLSRPAHPRITYLEGSSTDPEIVHRIATRQPSDGGVLVILDSDHRRAHVRRELEMYAPLLAPGDYLIVEDTNINGHPVLPAFGPGPHEAVEEFLQAHPEFERDEAREKFLLTFNPGGYLRRRDANAAAVAAPPVAERAVAAAVEPAVVADVTEALQAQVAELAPAFRTAIEQLEQALAREAGFREQLAEVGPAFRTAAEQLEQALAREAGLREQLAQIGLAFAEAVRQLQEAGQAAAGFRAAVELLQEMQAREAKLRAEPAPPGEAPAAAGSSAATDGSKP
jgi:cephalosporin hydroxylase